MIRRPWIRLAHSQAPQRSKPKLSGRGRFNPETDKVEYVQEHDYTVTPTTYTYTAEANQRQFERYPLLTNKSMAKRSVRPTNSRMLARDFMDDSLYNPHYGYFSKTAEIFSPEKPFDFGKISNIDDFLDEWTYEYQKAARGTANELPELKDLKFKEAKSEAIAPRRSRPSASASAAASATPSPSPATASKASGETKTVSRLSKQVWHTPTELFHPYYGQALARHMIAQYKAKNMPQLTIYEMGAGNGTLMVDVLDFIQKEEPEIYKDTSYNIIEISPSLAVKQRAHGAGHASKVKIINKSIFDWDQPVDKDCFFIALEVWDNFAHDVIRYDNSTDKPYQGYVFVDGNGDFTQIFSEKLDTLASQFIELRKEIDYKPQWKLGVHPLYQQPRAWRYLKNSVFNFHGNLSGPEYIPTRYLEFLQVLNKYFPKHNLLASDFTHFGDRVEGYNSPVVQTFMEGIPITLSTFIALQGYFDIMFCTDFDLAKQLYEKVTNKKATKLSHHDFLQQYSKGETSTKTGENPMLSFYRNAAFLTTN